MPVLHVDQTHVPEGLRVENYESYQLCQSLGYPTTDLITAFKAIDSKHRIPTGRRVQRTQLW